MQNKNVKLTYFILSLAALSIGFLCYYFFRDSNLIIYNIFNINITHNELYLSGSFLSYFLKYNLCDGLWILSGILFFRFLWFDSPLICKYYIFVFIGIALLMELLQLIDNIPGTFDLMDVLTMASFALLEQCINNIFTKQRRLKWVKIG